MSISLAHASSIAVASSLILFRATSAQVETISLQPVADTTLIETAPINNLGGAAFFNAGTAGNGNRNRALIRFDLSAIPAGSTITSAALTLDIVRQPASSPQNSTFSLRRVYQPWGEGAQVPADAGSPGQGAPAASGEATWNNRFAPGTPWSQPGGQTGADFSANFSSTAFVTTVGEQAVFESAPQIVADIQAWLANSSSNFGWMLMTESEEVARTARSFASLESGFGPTLTIEFTPIPEPSAIALVGVLLICLASIPCRRK